MSTHSPVRRSGRARQQPQRFSGDAVDPDAVEQLSDDESIEPQEAVGSEQAFSNGDGPDSPTSDPSPDNADTQFSEGMPSPEEDSGSDSDRMPRGPKIKPLSSATGLKRKRPGTVKANRDPPGGQSQRPMARNRGLFYLASGRRAPDVVQDLVGTDSSDISKLSAIVNPWLADPIAPSRANLATLPQGQDAGHETQDENGSRWYRADGVSDFMQEVQAMETITPPTAAIYYPRRLRTQKILMGPHWHQTEFSLELNSPLHLADSWKPAREATRQGEIDIERSGWVLNLGAKVHCVAWAPNITGKVQYLAVSLTKDSPAKSSAPSAFDPKPPYEAGIQLWGFHGPAKRDEVQEMDPGEPPQLLQALCVAWGMCVNMEWCPGSESSCDEQSPSKRLGILASVWADGYVRVLEVRLPHSYTMATVHVLYSDAAFAAKPPASICTSVTWVSERDIAVGCANGQVALWDVGEAMLNSKSDTNAGTPGPYAAHIFHHGYVLGVTSCFPSRPQLMVSVGTDGYTRLTDLRDPVFDTACASRSRIYPHAFAYCEPLGVALMSEGVGGVAALHVRRFFSKVSVRVCEAQITALACSKVHPFCLVGMSDGSVVLQNLAARMFENRNSGHSFELRWFRHEWVPETGVGSAAWYDEQASGDVRMEDAAPEQEDDAALRPGVSRITEGFAPTSRRAKVTGTKAKGKNPDSSKYETIYEEPSAITCIAWNPNARFGGWVAAGMGSGLLRVEDLAI